MRMLSVLPNRLGRLKRQHAIMLLLGSCAVVVLVVAAVVFMALQTVANRTNELDEARSRQALSGALATMRQQMETTIHDYTVWDDAAKAVYGPDSDDWILQNFALNGADTELFDIAYILDHQNNIVIAYKSGEPFSQAPASFFAPAFHEMLTRVKNAGIGAAAQDVGFVRTQYGVALVGISTIRAASPEIAVPLDRLQQLVFVRHLDEKRIAGLGETYAISGLTLVSAESPSASALDINDPSGTVVAKLQWSPMAPGEVSYRQVQPYVLFAMALAAFFFVVLILAGSIVIERLREDEGTARRQALTDRLSGLSNRDGFHSGLQAMIEEARLQGRDIALFYLDLDGFKEVNDTYGHATGDRLIRSVAAGLRHLVPPNALLARLGGDEFAVAFTLEVSAEQSALFEADVLDFLSEPIILGEHVVVVGASIGRAISGGGLVVAEELLRRADIAMYRAKADGRSRAIAYEPSMDAEIASRKTLELALRAAIEKSELHVVYQPIVDVKTRRVVCLEALLRWTAAGIGPVSPEVFIPLAEATGLIDRLGHFVLGEALHVAHRWPDVSLSVNVSPAQFRNPYFLPKAAALLDRSGVDPARLTLEVTEGYLINSPARAREVFDALKALGVRIALDDFGSGFSSIGYLRQFRFDRLKLDRSMVQAINEMSRGHEMLQATLALAHALDIPVTAEGIETEEQAMVLSLCGCDQLQGYFFGRPLPESELPALLNAHAETSAVASSA